jgi:Mg-chelatase subunit ChlD
MASVWYNVHIMRWWAFWRRVIYGIGFLIVFGGISTGLYFLYGYSPASCLDGKENGNETGTDCGGNCVRICTVDVTQPYVRWVRAFYAADGMYNAVAYVENKNANRGTPKIHYTMRLYDKDGLITEREGETYLAPNSLTPIFEGRISTGSRTPTETTIEFDKEQLWMNAVLGKEEFKLERRELTGADEEPVLTATLRNESLDEARDVDVVATIFDRQGNALTASRTKIPVFSPRSTKQVTFTWQEPIAKTLRSCEVPSDVVLAIDLSGSMNEDGGDPPEPITSVLTAASEFTTGMTNLDQLGLVTYATDARIVTTLTSEHTSVGSTIRSLVIDPKDERGSTNTGDALNRSREELTSSRHNEDARKVVILLTDGLATGPGETPEDYAREAAATLKAEHIELFTIGLGESLNEAFLRELASSEHHYFRAPNTALLQRIYEDITSAICEEGAAVIEILPRQSVVFGELVP